VSLTNPAPQTSAPLEVVTTPGGTVNVTFSYNLIQGSCPGCYDQLTVSFVGDSTAQACPYSGQPGPNGTGTQSASAQLTAPNTPGHYYIGVHKAQQYACLDTDPNANGQPGAVDGGVSASDVIIAAVDVISASNIQISPELTINNVNLGGTNGDYAQIQIGSAFNTNFTYTIVEPSYGPTDVEQVELGLNADSQAQVCVYNDTPGSPQANDAFSPPYSLQTSSYRPSRYYVAVERGLEFRSTCTLGQPVRWWSGVPNNNFNFFIGVVDVK
jgi:hypothetical protein